MTTAGILLTGGASRRMGKTKATIEVNGVALATHAASVLTAVCTPTVEVGPGYTTLVAVREDPPGEGPLAGVAAGWPAVDTAPAAIVLATDLPFITTSILQTLRDFPSTESVVPIQDGHLQPLCARYSSEALDTAVELYASGERSMRSLLDAISFRPWEFSNLVELQDVDTPDDLARAQASARALRSRT